MKGIISQRYRIDEGKVKVIENWALDDLEKNPITPVKKEDERALKILYTGNMGRSHEYKTLLDGIKGLRNTPGIDFIITGGGYNYEIFKKEAEKDNLGNIRFKGFVPKKELSELIDSADLCIVIGNEELIGHIVPSKFYGYLSRAKPILYINSGNDEISHHISIGQLGFQIPNGSSEEFCKVVFDVYNNKAVLAEMSACAASYYASNLKRNISLDKYLFLIKESEETLAK
jgi:glycosyltransferase involved in cell wall biosynthesis